MRLLARTRLLVLTSIMEGGANVVSEALACNVPVISTHISGSVGLLGPDYPGYFPVGDTKALAGMLLRAEQDPLFYKSLKAGIRSQRKIPIPLGEGYGKPASSGTCAKSRIRSEQQRRLVCFQPSQGSGWCTSAERSQLQTGVTLNVT